MLTSSNNLKQDNQQAFPKIKSKSTLDLRFTNYLYANFDNTARLNFGENLLLLGKMESFSPKQYAVFYQMHRYQSQVDDKIIPSNYRSIRTIAKDAGCCRRTVERTFKKFPQMIKRKHRYKNKKQITNRYFFDKQLGTVFKMLDKFGMHKPDADYGKLMKWVQKKFFEDCDADFARFSDWANRNLSTRQRSSNKRLRGSSEQAEKSMSPLFKGICRTDLLGINFKLEYSTALGTYGDEISAVLKKLEKDCVERIVWYKNQGNPIRYPMGFIRDCALRSLTPPDKQNLENKRRC